MNFTISIIMPVYNVAEHLERAIQSALKQTKQDFEIILVNDGSTDGSAEICDAYAEKEPLIIQVIHQKNQGAGAARNAGLKKASGKYIYFADPDDYFKSTLIQQNVQLAEEKNSQLVVFGYTREPDREPENREEKLPNLPQLRSKEEFRKHFRNFYHFSPYALWNKVYRKDFLVKNKISFTDQLLGQDALFNIEVFKELGQVAFNRKALYHYVQHEGSAVHSYRPDRFALEYNIAKQFEKMIYSWGMQEEFRDLIVQEYWNSIYLELANVTHQDCPMTQDEKEKWIELIFHHKKLTKYMEDDSLKKEKNPFRRILIHSVRNKDVTRSIQIMQKRMDAALNYRNLFFKVRTFFKS